MLRRHEATRTPLLTDETMVVATQSFRPAFVAKLIERGACLRFDDPRVQANLEHFALPLAHLLELKEVEKDG